MTTLLIERDLKKPGIWINGIPLYTLEGSKPPATLQEAFEEEIWAHGLVYLELKYILQETINIELRKENPKAGFECGEMGEAIFGQNLVVVVESRFGVDTTIKTMRHEVRHFYDGPHPWLEEKQDGTSWIL